MPSATSSDWSRSLLLLFTAAMALCYSTTAQNETSPDVGSLIPEDVVVVAGANPRVAVIYWKPIADIRISIYTVYYTSNTTATNTEQRMEVISLANSAMVDSLEIGHHYTFTVSVGYIVDGVITMGPRSANTNITTGLTTLNSPDNATDDNTGNVGAVIFYGCLLIVSMVINLALLVMSYVLLRQLRLKYNMGNGTTSPCIELQTRHDVNIHHDDIPRKPAREHVPPKDVMIELQNGRCTTPAKQADVEAL